MAANKVFHKEYLVNLRKLHKLTGRQLASAAGLTQGTIVNLETGVTTNPNPKTVDKIAKQFGKIADDFWLEIKPKSEVVHGSVNSEEASYQEDVAKPTAESLDNMTYTVDTVEDAWSHSSNSVVEFYPTVVDEFKSGALLMKYQGKFYRAEQLNG